MAKSDVVDFNVLESISVITKKLENSKLKIRRTQEFIKAEENLNKYFNTTTYGTWFLCGMISYYFNHNGDECNFNNLANIFSVSVMSIIAYKAGMEDLLSKGYILNSDAIIGTEIGLKNTFKISQELLNFVLHNRKIENLHHDQDSFLIIEAVKKIGDIIETTDDWFGKIFQVEEFENRFSNTDFIRNVRQLVPDDRTARMFFYDCCSDIFKSIDTSLYGTICCVYSESSKMSVAESFMKEEHILIRKELIEFVEKGSLTEATLDLTIKAKELLLGDKANLFMKTINGLDYILPDSIISKKLFYSDDVLNDINRLKSSLYEDNLKSIQNRLSEKGLQKGIVVLLYGSPGTGKTESVY